LPTSFAPFEGLDPLYLTKRAIGNSAIRPNAKMFLRFRPLVVGLVLLSTSMIRAADPSSQQINAPPIDLETGLTYKNFAGFRFENTQIDRDGEWGYTVQYRPPGGGWLWVRVSECGPDPVPQGPNSRHVDGSLKSLSQALSELVAERSYELISAPVTDAVTIGEGPAAQRFKRVTRVVRSQGREMTFAAHITGYRGYVLNILALTPRDQGDRARRDFEAFLKEFARNFKP
jgi:hypothetical protein